MFALQLWYIIWPHDMKYYSRHDDGKTNRWLPQWPVSIDMDKEMDSAPPKTRAAQFSSAPVDSWNVDLVIMHLL